jgi:hypothetical protein
MPAVLGNTMAAVLRERAAAARRGVSGCTAMDARDATGRGGATIKGR